MQWVVFVLVMLVVAAGVYIKHLHGKVSLLSNDLDEAEQLHAIREDYVEELEDFAINAEVALRVREDDETSSMSADDVADFMRKRFSASN